MADKPAESAPSTSSVDENVKPKRSQPFTRQELQFIVEYLENHEYSLGSKGCINYHKATVLEDLAAEIELKFGQRHSERQIQKRYSDLRVREKATYNSIKQRIAREAMVKGGRGAEQDEQGTPGKEQAEVEQAQNEEMITITLEPITEPQMLITEPGSQSGTITQNLLFNFDDRVMQQLGILQSCLLAKIESLESKFEGRMVCIEEEIAKLRRHCFVMEP